MRAALGRRRRSFVSFAFQSTFFSGDEFAEEVADVLDVLDEGLPSSELVTENTSRSCPAGFFMAALPLRLGMRSGGGSAILVTEQVTLLVVAGIDADEEIVDGAAECLRELDERGRLG